MSRAPSYANQTLADADFIDLYQTLGPKLLAETLEVPKGTLWSRMCMLRKTNPQLNPLNGNTGQAKNKTVRSLLTAQQPSQHAPRLTIEINTGTAIVFSDAHYWPGKPSTAHRALVKFIQDNTPNLIICNGDAVDMASVSRHPPIGWEKRPTVQEEIENAQERLGEILGACTKKTRKTWNLGNHDARFETKLASIAPEYAKVAGIHLHDHFPEWDRAWSTWINNDVVVKHRFKGGDHATWNNTLRSGKTTVTGHLHSARVTPYTDYNGTRYGVDTGCIADPSGSQFTNYTEDNPKNWISAFCVLTFHKGKLMWPELCTVWNEHSVQFRGKIIGV